MELIKIFNDNDMSEIVEITKTAKDRFQLWSEFIDKKHCSNLCEIGVYKGAFAESLLKNCKGIVNYYMIDPWRNLADWNKPANTDNEEFELYYKETIAKTEFAKEKIHILRGKTIDVLDKIKDESLDFAYIDGDHTLKGITLDLLSVWKKIRPNGFIGGDDFCASIWQHSEDFEPTLVFPFAVYFAEAMNTKIIALPFRQFLITKEQKGFEFVDLAKGKYKTQTLKELIGQKPNSNKNIISKIKNKFN